MRASLWALCVLVWAVVGALLLTPMSGGDGGLPLPDKVLHAGAWAALAGALWLALSLPLRRRAVAVLAACLVYAVATELLQGLVPTRSTDAWDAAADMAGAAVAVAALTLLARGRRRQV